MGKYKKKPVVIEAFKFYYDNMPDWFVDNMTSRKIDIFNCGRLNEHLGEAYCEIETLEGVMRGNKGDYIIRGVKGEIYPCKPDVFKMTYEEVK